MMIMMGNGDLESIFRNQLTWCIFSGKINIYMWSKMDAYEQCLTSNIVWFVQQKYVYNIYMARLVIDWSQLEIFFLV